MISKEQIEQIRRLTERGMGIKPIVRVTGFCRGTVRRYVRLFNSGAEIPSKTKRPSKLDPYRDRIHELYLLCNGNCGEVLRKIEAEFDITIGLRQLQKYCTRWRRGELSPQKLQKIYETRCDDAKRFALAKLGIPLPLKQLTDTMAKIQRNPVANQIAEQLLKNKKPESIADLNDILMQIFEGVAVGIQQDNMQTGSIAGMVPNTNLNWQDRPLPPVCAFAFVDSFQVSICNTHGTTRNQMVHYIIGINADGYKVMLGMKATPGDTEEDWKQFFDSIRARGVMDILFLATENVLGLKEGLRAVYPETCVHPCIAQLVRNSLRYVKSSDQREFRATLKEVYSAADLETCRANFEAFVQRWNDRYVGGVRAWADRRLQIEQLFEYHADIREVLCITNTFESFNTKFRKAVKNIDFENEDAILNVLSPMISSLTQTWAKRIQPGWIDVRNQLAMLDGMIERMETD